MKRRLATTTAITAVLALLCSCGGSSPSKPAPSLQSISVSVASEKMEVGETCQFTATGVYSDGSTRNVSTTAIWTSSNASVAQVSNAGAVTAHAAGSATITASLEGRSSGASVTVSPALKSISISPLVSSVSIGDSIALTATGTYSDSSTKNLTSLVSWASSNVNAATIADSGTLTVIAAGDTTITATMSGVTGSLSLHVQSSKVLVSLAVTATPTAVLIGETSQFSAIATYDDSTSANVTSAAHWSSSAPAIATVNSSGVATGVSAGSAVIQAAVGVVTGHATLTVNPILVSIDIVPPSPSVLPNTTTQLTANGNYSDRSQRDLTSQVEWSSTDTSVATINRAGVVTALAAGTSSISASFNGVVGTANLTVRSPELVSILIDQDGITIPRGAPQQLTVTGVFSDTTTATLESVSWSSSDPSIVSIDAAGLASALQVGSVTITATSGSVSGTGTLNVGVAVLRSVALAPIDPSLPLGLTQQFTLVGTFSDRTTQNLTEGVTWESSDTSTATIDSSGLASSFSVGSTVIKATVGELSASSTLTVTPAEVVSIAVNPDQASVPAGVTQQFSATVAYTDRIVPNFPDATWSSSEGTIATVNNSGLATARQAGEAQITASFGGAQGSATLTVTPAFLTQLTITPGEMSAPVGNRIQFSATGQYSDGTSRDLTQLVDWSSSTAQTLTIDSDGLALARQTGSVTVTAVYEEQSASILVTVVPLGMGTSPAPMPVISPSTGTFTTAQTITITTGTPGIWIYYTMDGSQPTTSSTLYTTSFTVSTTTTVKAIAAGGSYNASPVARADYTIAAAAPVISPASGVYLTPQTVTISSSTPGTSIYYTTDGSQPTTSSTVYTTSFTVGTATTVRAIAAGGNYAASAVARTDYTIAAEAPVISPASGAYFTPQTVTITSSTPGTSIYYTTDGSTPTTSSTVYTTSFTVGTATTVKAIAAGGGYAASAVAMATYTSAAAAPLISPVSGVYSDPQTVTITSSTPGTSIYYTTDGSTPTTGSTMYSAPFMVSTTTTVKAIAAGGSYGASAVMSAFLTIAAAAPAISPSSGVYLTSQTVTITSSTPGTSIYYTTDGSTPTTGSTMYSAPFTVSTTTTVKAIAAGGSYSASAVTSAFLTIAAAAPMISPSSGVYLTPQTVAITSNTPGTSIYYTTDGSTPTTGSTVYSAPLIISTTTTVKAIAAGGSYGASAVALATFTIETN